MMKELLSSKKFVAMIVGLVMSIATKYVPGLDEETTYQIVGLVIAYILGQGVADAGKEKAKIEKL